MCTFNIGWFIWFIGMDRIGKSFISINDYTAAQALYFLNKWNVSSFLKCEWHGRWWKTSKIRHEYYLPYANFARETGTNHIVWCVERSRVSLWSNGVLERQKNVDTNSWEFKCFVVVIAVFVLQQSIPYISLSLSFLLLVHDFRLNCLEKRESLHANQDSN